MFLFHVAVGIALSLSPSLAREVNGLLHIYIPFEIEIRRERRECNESHLADFVRFSSSARATLRLAGEL